MLSWHPLKHQGLIELTSSGKQKFISGMAQNNDFSVLGEFIVCVGLALIPPSSDGGLEAKGGGRMSHGLH